jgi:hypothetical protein
MRMRYPSAWVAQLLQGVRAMKESTTYQAILAEGAAMGEAKGEARGEARGKAEEAKKLLLLLGGKRFGAPEGPAAAAVDALTSVEHLERLVVRLEEASGWEELLDLPRPRRRNGRRGKKS